MSAGDFWSDPDRVREFAARDPDHRLQAWMAEVPDPRSVRVLDLGCAGGRNTVYLAGLGAEVEALDATEAMVAATREGLARHLGLDTAISRVQVGAMDDLSRYPHARFDLVVALGIYQLARDEDELRRALAETRRVVRPGGEVLSSVFGPGTRFPGRELIPVPGHSYQHLDPAKDTLCLLGEHALDEEMARVGLRPVVPTFTVVREGEEARRVVANGHHRRER
jgi:SAM-dependent methyltransferase